MIIQPFHLTYFFKTCMNMSIALEEGLLHFSDNCGYLVPRSSLACTHWNRLECCYTVCPALKRASVLEKKAAGSSGWRKILNPKGLLLLPIKGRLRVYFMWPVNNHNIHLQVHTTVSDSRYVCLWLKQLSFTDNWRKKLDATYVTAWSNENKGIALQLSRGFIKSA